MNVEFIRGRLNYLEITVQAISNPILHFIAS